ncbi:hypothetical protein GNX18_02080 [Microbulbifer sp. SH-1]|uniref:hypothetical protein n=1 Tax=Microbulbifer sp. SH-1 TaxID=2681547 RepID=UPI001407A525|nr:hypothetical protein [Microbulbifer sp. SH-1]QIL88694.1 hypothetical protein GNX18_02080 [Microbulbifer sp. SH-1]
MWNIKNSNCSIGGTASFLIVLLLIAPLAILPAKTLAEGWRYEYDFYLDGDIVGTVSRQVDKLGSSTEVQETVVYTEPAIDKDVEVSISRSERYGPLGRLQLADTKQQRGKAAYWSRIESVGGELWAIRSPVESLSEKEDAQFVGFAFAAVADAVPLVGQVVSYSSILLGDSENAEGNNRLPDSGYDSTLHFLPEFWQLASESLPEQVNILDISGHRVWRANVVAVENLGRAGSCYRMDSDELDSLEFCLDTGENGWPHYSMLRQSTVSGSFELRLRSLAVDSGAVLGSEG